MIDLDKPLQLIDGTPVTLLHKNYRVDSLHTYFLALYTVKDKDKLIYVDHKTGLNYWDATLSVMNVPESKYAFDYNVVNSIAQRACEESRQHMTNPPMGSFMKGAYDQGGYMAVARKAVWNTLDHLKNKYKD